MADTIQELCLKSVKAALDTVAAANPPLKIFRGRSRPPSKTDLPCLNQIDGLDETETTGTAELHEMEVDIEGFMTNPDETLLQTEISNLQGKVWQAVKGLTPADPNIIQIIPGGVARDRDDEEGTSPFLAFTLSINLVYQTTKGDPFTIG